MEKPVVSDTPARGIFSEFVAGLDATAQTQFFESIIMNARLWLMFLDPERNVVIWNRAAVEITGYSAHDVLGKNEIWKWLYPDPEYRRKVTKTIVGIIRDKKSLENFETTILTKNKETRRISWNTRELTGNNQKRIGYIVLGNDITEIAKAKNEIRRYAEFHESVIVNAKLWMTFLDADRNIVIWNKAAEEITGYTRDEVIGHSEVWKWLYPDPDYRRVVTKKIRDIISNSKFLENYETRILTKMRRIRYISWNTRELTGEDGTCAGYIVVGNDITEKLLAKKEIKEREEMFRSIASATSEAIGLLDRNGVIWYWNPAAETLFGAGADFVLRKNFFSLFSPPEFHEDDRQNFIKFFDAATGPFASERREIRLQKITGEVVHAEISLSTVVIHGLWHAIAVIRDISDRIRAEMHEREILVNAVMQSSPIPQFMIDTDHHIIFWNHAMEEYTGIKAADVTGTDQHWRAFYDTERPCLADLLIDGEIDRIPQWYAGKFNKSKLVEGAYEATDFFPKIGREGTWLYFTAALVRDSHGTIVGVLETLEDITDAVLYKSR